MRALENYRLGKELHSSPFCCVFSAVRESDGRDVVLKAYANDRSADGRSRASLEFDALRAAAGTGVAEALEVSAGEDGPVLVQARVVGISLAEWIAAKETTPATFLEMALQLADVLTRVHEARLVHRDVSCTNILIDPVTLRTHLIDFGLARPLGAATARGETRNDPEALVGTLPYISPEQTGRMGRGVDSRSDLYSLGAVFYHALAGRPPFASADPLQLIHAHMAKVPASVVELRPELPATVCRIVAKLLQKSPEDRYQTARALHRDLLECRQQLERTGIIEDDLVLGTADAPYRPLFSRRLYGREAELRALHDAYARAATGSAAVVFLKGAPGIGKSALVHELHAPLTQSSGYLAQGKFDLYRRDIPYSGFLQAFDSFTQQILTESDACLTRWRAELSLALGGIARVLVDLIPDLGAVLGDTPPVPPLGPSQTLARLSLAIQRFVQAVAIREHPLVLFFDDVHWADAGSRALLRDLLLESQSCALLALGAYRDGEVDSSHPLQHLLTELEECGRPVVTVTLAPLSDEACAHMLADALGRTPDETRTLAACVARKTGNTPLIIQQFVQHVYDRRLMRFESGRGWTWDDEVLAATDIPDDAVTLMTAKIGRLDERTRDVLKVASCIGDRFDAPALAEFVGVELAATESALCCLADEGMLAPCPEGFRFSHDRIREAAQSLWPDAERRNFHDRIGRRLLERTPAAALDEHILEILDHLNRAPDHVVNDGDRTQRIELNLRAGTRALRAGAAVAGERYLAAGRALFLESDWARSPVMSFELHAQSAECAFSSRRYDDALALLDVLEHRPTLSHLELARIAARRTSIYAVTRSQPEAVEAGLAGLARLGFRIPAEPSRARVWLTTLRSRWLLRGLTENDIGPSDPRNPRWLPAQLILSELIGPAFRTSWRLASLIANVALRAATRWGTAGPAFSVSGAAMIVAYYTGNYALGSQHADLVLRILEHQPGQSSFFRARMSVFAFIKAFVLPLRSVFAEMRRCRDDALEHGDVSFALYAENLRAHMMWIAGEPLGKLERMQREFIEFSRNLGYTDWRSVEPLLAVYAALTGTGSEPPPELSAEFSSPLLMPIRSAWIACHCMLGDYRRALEESEAMLVDIDRVYCNMPHVPEFWFFRGLSAASLAGAERGRARRRLCRILARSSRKMRGWARHGPANFEPAALLLEAENARLSGQAQRALLLYKRSAESARSHEHPHHEALAHERLARLLLGLRRKAEAESSLLRAGQLYETWGASMAAARLHLEGRE